MALALPGGPSTPKKKDKKRVRKDPKKDAKDKELDSDAELEVSAEDLVGADAEEGPSRKRRREDDDEDGGDGGEDGEDGEDAPADVVVEGTRARDVKREAKRRREEIFLFRGALDDEQAKRFDAFRSAIIPKNAIKKINKVLYDQNVPQNVVAVVATMVKVFVADVVETAREIQKHTEDPTGPLRPYHLQMARMQLQEQGLVGTPAGLGSARSSTGLRPRRSLFRR